ncbi:MAG: 30S ribosomal protein S12 methylthiotransferase RimO [Candidatus Eisenbacteria bacterium]|nr:30S ribosomal protein S12 methylthiotransferase RimO [Candidatus Eisenbacteria bacterium]
MRIALITLGCPKNLIDAEHMLGALHDAGHDLVGDPASSDVVIVNTCSFIASAVDESSRAVRDVLALREEGWRGRVLVAGCLPERYGRRTFQMFPGVDAVVGCLSVARILDAVEGAAAGDRPLHVGTRGRSVDGRFPRILGTPGHLAYIRISEGCDNRCAYCVIPSIRGPLVSHPARAIIHEARELHRAGVRELIPVAQDTTAYGMDIAPSVSLAGLLAELDDVGIPWIRLLYAHPARITDDLLETLGRGRHLARYLDVPIQHVSDAILAPMNRKTDGRAVRGLADRIRRVVPDMTLRTSVIVGFPGEGPTEFEELRRFLAAGPFDHLGVFEYSPEEGSPAFRLGEGASREETRERAGILLEEARERTERRHGELVGSTVEVLIDEPGPAAVGRTEGLAWELDGVVRIDDPAGALRPGAFATVEVTGASGFDLEAATPQVG